ncbi:DMT family transporter [Bacteroides sp.]|uniref:DMT family transporter n=1 Tax=Bacteroides sp. TaxID=29523 RepID=UPI001B4ADC55|nr:DMT family transporter [Bacteroides sp.]MBP6065640.1 DMT family transporter [Bacteroides sp.]MBP6067743.1 DMT family transporter [Bacteroides sp.]MBP6936748.1 DMT family transporter [Bacteroides sp.]MBP8622209.1 DMT family transporter [Bacteroides sp.]MBP9585675.1 DMT family transporter [Bacteroides sp.]
MTDHTKATVYAGIAVLSWSTVATAFKLSLKYLTHFEMLLVASCTALLLFTLLLTFQQKWALVATLSRRQWGRFALIGLLNPVAYYLVLFKAYALLPAQVAQPINYAWPIVLLILLALFARQPIPRKKYIGMCMSLGGVALISLGSGSLAGASVSVYGLLLAALSAFLWAGYWMVNNKNRLIDSSVALFMSFLFGTLYLLGGACVVGVNISTLPGILSGMYVGAFEIALPFTFFGLAMRTTTNPALINQLCYLSPFLSLFLIAVVLGEQIVTTTYIGLALIVLGIVFNEYFAAPRQRA